MKNLDKANDWLKRAKSNMARAKSGRVSPDILYEDLSCGIQEEYLRKLSRLSDEGARKDLNELVEKNVLDSRGKGRNTHYILK